MSEQRSDNRTILDQMVSQDQIQVMKAALPYVPPSGQRFLSVMAKMMELQNTISLFSKPRGEMSICAVENEKVEPLEMLQDIRRFCNGPTQERIDSLINTLVMVQILELSQDNNNTYGRNKRWTIMETIRKIIRTTVG